MALTNFTGVRSAYLYKESNGTFFNIAPNELGSDGVEFQIEDNTITNGTWAGDRSGFNGYNIDVATLAINPKNHYTLGAIFDQGFDPTTGAYAPLTTSCSTQGVTLTLVKLCDKHEVIQFRHTDLSFSNDNSVNRDDVFTHVLQFIPNEAPASDYGITATTGSGLLATDIVPWIMFDGTYDPATNTNTFAPSQTITFPTAGEITIAAAA